MKPRSTILTIARWACGTLSLVLLVALIGGVWYGASGPITSTLSMYIGRGRISIMARSAPRTSSIEWSIGKGEIPFALAGHEDWSWWFDQTDVGFVGNGRTINITVTTVPLWIPTVLLAVASAMP